MANAKELGLDIGDYVLGLVGSAQDQYSVQYALRNPIDVTAPGVEPVFDVLRIQSEASRGFIAQILDTTHKGKKERIGSRLVLLSEFPNLIDTILPRLQKTEDAMVHRFLRIGVENIHMEVRRENKRVVILQNGKPHTLQFK